MYLTVFPLVEYAMLVLIIVLGWELFSHPRWSVRLLGGGCWALAGLFWLGRQ
jgi:hypothetical protein